MSYSSLVEKIVANMVREPDAVHVKESRDREGVIYYVTVAPNDVGLVIGKNGRVISAIRYVVSAAAAKSRQKAFVKIVTENA